MRYSRHSANDPGSFGQRAISLLPLVLGALMVLILMGGLAQPVSAQYPVLPTATAVPTKPAASPVAPPYPVAPTATTAPAPPTATPVPAPPTATVAAPAPTTPPVAQPTAAPVAPTKPATLPTPAAAATAVPVAPLPSPTVSKTPVAVIKATATPAGPLSVPQVATAISQDPAASVEGDGPFQLALRSMLTGLGALWLAIGVIAFLLALVAIGYLFMRREGRS